MKSEVFIHFGLHKTGTTFLQDVVFSKLEGINFIDRRIDFLIKILPGKNLISSEIFSVNPFDTKFHKGLTPADRFVVADRLKKIFPDAKVIVGVREKESWKRSLYSEFIKGQGLVSYEKFVKKYDLDEWTNFDEYISYLKKIFDDVYVYHFEDLKNDYKGFIKGICDFIGADIPRFKNEVINRRITDGFAMKRKWYNLITGGFERLARKYLLS